MDSKSNIKATAIKHTKNTRKNILWYIILSLPLHFWPYPHAHFILRLIYIVLLLKL